MKNIAFVCELIGTVREGGENIAMLRLANGLKSLGESVDTYTYTHKDKKLKINSIIPIQLRLLPFVREIFFVPFIGYRLLHNFRNNYDIVFASSMTIASFLKPKNSLIIVCHLIRSQKFQTLSKVPKYKLLFNPFTYLLMSSLERNSLNNAGKIIVIREQQKKYLVEKLKVDANKINVIPNGINVDFFKPKKVPKKNQVIFVGRGTIPKGIDTLLKAADMIDANILIVTQKIDQQFLSIARSKSNVSIKLHATPEDMVGLYSESQVFVLPSLNEEQPLSTLEAMSCGLPVVVTKEAGSDIVKNDVHGFIIPESDPEILSEKVNYLLRNQKLRNTMSKNNRNHVIQNYNAEKIMKEIHKLLYD